MRITATANIHKASLTESKPVNTETFGTLINLAGRQRMLSQRFILNAILAELGHEDALEVAKQALELFENTHRDLVMGNQDLPGVFFDALNDIYFGMPQSDRKIRAFIEEAKHTLACIATDGSANTANRLGQQATPLVGILNQITMIYESEAKRHAQTQQKQHKELMGNIQQIAKHARIVSVNAQIMAARAGEAGKEFSVVAEVLSNITEEIEELIVSALASSQH